MSRVLASRWLPSVLAGLATMLCAGSLSLGRYADDWVHQAILSGSSLFPGRSPLDLFAFLSGDQKSNMDLIQKGLLPWWSDPQLHLSFFRPLSSLTHWIDYRLWPQRASLMHLHSLFWLGLCVMAAGDFYRRLLPPVSAGLATLLLAIDDAHLVPAMWLANRNALVSFFFGILALLAHMRWREDGWRYGAVLAPLSLLLSLLGGEAGISALAYIVSYALFLDQSSPRLRFRSTIPAAVTAIGWLLVRGALGYGASGSGLYVDPLSEPLRFAEAVVSRAPALLWGLFVLPSDLFALFWGRAAVFLWLLAIASLLLLISLSRALLLSQRAARFCACGLLLSLVPACATFISDRLLLFASLGGMGLLSLLLMRLRIAEPGMRGKIASFTFWVLIGVHCVFSPLRLVTGQLGLATFRDVFSVSAESFPSDPAVAGQRILIVSTPTSFVSQFAPLIQALDGKPVPDSSLVLSSGIYGADISRPGLRTLAIRPRGGFLAVPGQVPEKIRNSAPLTPLSFFPLFDRLFVADPCFTPGHQVDLGDLTVEVVSVTEDGRPLEVAFRFARPLDDHSYRWLRWQDGVYVSFTLPGVGKTVTLPPLA